MHYMRARFTSLYHVHFFTPISHSRISEYDKEKSISLHLSNQLGFFVNLDILVIVNCLFTIFLF